MPRARAAVKPLFIGHDIFHRSTYGGRHPLAIPRVSACIDLCRALGWIDPDRYIVSPQATHEQLLRFHDADYLDALQSVEAGAALTPEMKARYNIGINGNPVFAEIFSRPATACGATLHAVEALREPGVIYSPAGGTHHGRPAQASGFCYLNDPVLGILAFLDQGVERLLYIDIDAHHCDAVQDALAGDPRVRILSVHEDGRWPRTGALRDDGGGTVFNVPVPPGFHDDDMALLLDELILPVAQSFRPQVVILQGGADALAEDPLARLDLSNNAHWSVVRAVTGMADRVLVTGGGGYNPWSVARCWAGAWATIDGRDIPDRLPAEAEDLLRNITWQRSAGRNPPGHWFTTLRDAPRNGPITPAVREAVTVLRPRLASI